MGHVTITTPLFGVIFHLFGIAYLYTKFDSLSCSLDMDGASKIYKRLCYGRGTARRASQ